ncbi:MAG TPA: hypothetical protein VFO58_12305 [Vicinamibacterales bacterium]|nr:hypothetical protein [Vicinamibacterales bacterium]
MNLSGLFLFVTLPPPESTSQTLRDARDEALHLASLLRPFKMRKPETNRNGAAIILVEPHDDGCEFGRIADERERPSNGLDYGT